MLSEDGAEIPDGFDYWFRSSFSPYVVHASASISCILFFVWTLRYRGSVALSGADLFNLHPLLMSVAFTLLVPESILLLRFAGFKRNLSKPAHASLHALALLLAILGFAAGFKSKQDRDLTHFHSLHSWVGISLMVLFIGQWLFGLYLF